ncbi:prolipoprotein diacylglyceryl transferase [Thermobrachium celere]|uniref:Phosphatidylglycerol--prolipoprotein diacylglyceryl transferase n=1 Tax=Thermobrachium celere DSM 8682 TaxID=941824 RepID=R7RPA0_9CLOT|nr:prolipoprotein diacylglyceryl transferase [Thermobrachium celere]GFR34452.1 prolipoprotein diacylglyceryl transferase [Thermobrachium celere]CDF57201.1 Prolipoprotein diacylglyceryl transferase [Thermobrachium celere DSM 8682]
MHPILFRIGNITIYSYGFMMVVGILSAILLTIYRAKKQGISEDVVMDIAIYGVIAGIIGAKLLFLIAEAPYIFKNPAVLKDMITGGFVVYGALIGGVLAAYIYCRIKKVDFLKMFDIAAPSIAIAQGFGRIGCLFAGCCYGRETTSPFGIVFKNSPFAPNGVKLIPTQIISSVGDFLIGFILLYFSTKTNKKGQVAGLYMILYSVGRFFVEFLRNDPRGNVLFLSTSQFICIFVFIIGIYVFNIDKLRRS